MTTPIMPDPRSPLWAWPWLTHSAPPVRAALFDVAARNNWDPNALAAVIDLESGGDPRALNPDTGATGLIQFMPDTARSMGTSVEALAELPADRQLAYVEAFLRSNLAGRVLTDVGDYYLVTFMPGRVGSPDSFVLARKGSDVYRLNRGLDVDQDGTLSVGDVRDVLRRKYGTAQVRVQSGALPFLDLGAPALRPPPTLPFARRRSVRGGLGSWVAIGVVLGSLEWLRRKVRS